MYDLHPLSKVKYGAYNLQDFFLKDPDTNMFDHTDDMQDD